MLIDINAYVGHWPFMQFKYNTCDALGQRMDRFGTDVSVIRIPSLQTRNCTMR
jgi:hypothetical protein